MKTVFVPATVSQSRAYNVWSFSELPDDIQDEIIERQEPDYDFWSECIRETIDLNIDNFYPEFLPNGMEFDRKPSRPGSRNMVNDVEYESDSYDNFTVTFAAHVDTCQLLSSWVPDLPICKAVCDRITIEVCHPNRYDNERVTVDYFEDDYTEDDETEPSIKFETELERLKESLEEAVSDIEGKMETNMRENAEYYGSKEYWLDTLSNDETLYFIDGSDVPYDIASR